MRKQESELSRSTADSYECWGRSRGNMQGQRASRHGSRSGASHSKESVQLVLSKVSRLPATSCVYPNLLYSALTLTTPACNRGHPNTCLRR